MLKYVVWAIWPGFAQRSEGEAFGEDVSMVGGEGFGRDVINPFVFYFLFLLWGYDGKRFVLLLDLGSVDG